MEGDECRAISSDADRLALFLILILAVCLGFVLILLLFAYCFNARVRHHLEGKTVCIVGAARGIGQQVACLLVAQKSVKCLLLVDMMSCEETEKLCREQGCEKVVQLRCDIADKEQLSSLFSSVEKLQLGFIYLLVDCAGVVSGKSFEELNVDDFERVVQVNLTSKFSLLKFFVPMMLQQGIGCVVSVSSIMGLMGGARLMDYSSSKFGLIGLFESMRLEYRSSHPNISFVTVCPYAVDTGMFDGIFEANRLTRMIRYIFPLLKAKSVAAAIVSAAERGTAYEVVPFYLGPLINIARCLPSPFYEIVSCLMGGEDGMKSFRGKSPIRV